MRTIAVVTGARSDYGLLLPVLRAIEAAPELRLHLIAAASHFERRFGETVRFIRQDGFRIDDEVRMDLSDDSPAGIARATGQAVLGFGEVFARRRGAIDLLVLLGDRYETLAAAVAALPHLVPVAHIHGGEVTRGAIDDAVRHAITKLAHLHFAATREAAARIRQMGEEPWRVVVSGAPGLDTIRAATEGGALIARERLLGGYGLDPARPVLLTTFHPVTLEHEAAAAQIAEVLGAIDHVGHVGAQVLFTAPNADTAGRVILGAIERFIEGRNDRRLIASTGQNEYLSLLACADAMVGNSSSGILEAPSFRLPVVNIGTRQDGRERARNVIDCACERDAIARAIAAATAPAFRASLDGLVNPYGDGYAAERIVAALRSAPLGDALLRKRFVDEGERKE